MIPNTLKLRELLFLNRRSQIWLATESGVTRNTVNAICNGKSCSTKTARKIADALGVKLEEITQQ